MAQPTDFTPPSSLWVLLQHFKGVFYSSTVTLPPADLREKSVLITGANSGIGREAALLFATWGANVVLACRSRVPAHEPHPEAVVEECRAAAAAAGHKTSLIEYWECDMSSLASVQALGARFVQTGRPLDVFASNAGIPPTQTASVTEDGFETLQQVNFLSHALLTLLLLPALARAVAPRVVYTSSNMHYFGGESMDYGNLRSRLYEVNKLFLLMWMHELQARMAKHPEYQHIVAHGLHPGYVASGLFDQLEKQGTTGFVNRMFCRLRRYLAISPQQGSLAIVNAAIGAEFGARPDSDDGLRGGALYFNRIWPEEPLPHVRSPGCRNLLWDYVSSELKLQEMSTLEPGVKSFAA